MSYTTFAAELNHTNLGDRISFTETSAYLPLAGKYMEGVLDQFNVNKLRITVIVEDKGLSGAADLKPTDVVTILDSAIRPRPITGDKR